jgi:hypothetical protein
MQIPVWGKQLGAKDKAAVQLSGLNTGKFHTNQSR